MTSSISTVTVVPGATAVAKTDRPATLDADLAKAEGQLADWVACPSCKTPEGKAKIEEISAKVDAIKSKMVAVEKARPRAVDAAQTSAGDASRNRPGSALSTLGGVVDAYA